MNSRLDAVVIGPLNIDLILNGSAPRDIDALLDWMALSEVTLNVAGSAGYPAQALQALGVQTGIVSIVADDALGDVIRRGLADSGIDLARLHVAKGEQSSIAVYMLLFGSKKRPLTGRPVQHKPWPDPLDAYDVSYISSARLIHIAGYMHYPSMWDDDIPALLRDAHQRGQLVSLDPQFPLYPVDGPWLKGIERLLPYVDVLLTDQDEARGITGLADLDAAGRMLQPLLNKSGYATVVIKRGAEGALMFNGSGESGSDIRCVEQPALIVPEAEIIDTIGAGDAFDAGFLGALLRDHAPADALKIGTAVAALSLRGHGVANVIANSDNIETVIRQLLR